MVWGHTRSAGATEGAALACAPCPQTKRMRQGWGCSPLSAVSLADRRRAGGHPGALSVQRLLLEHEYERGAGS